MLLFTCLVLYRLANAFLIQTQFDPDEYWQTLEPAYCIVFSRDGEQNCALTWEWTRKFITEDPKISSSWLDRVLHGPVRSYVPILPFILLYKFLKFFHLDNAWTVSRGPILLNAVLVAAPSDYAIYYISKFLDRQSSKDFNTQKSLFHRVEIWALLASLTNWFHGYGLVRTYSNSLETALLVNGIALLCCELFADPEYTSDDKIRSTAQLGFLLGGLSVSTRFTSLAAWIPLGIATSMRRRSTRSRLYYIFRLCIICGAAGVGLGCLLDRYFYGFWAVPFLGSFHFNVILGNGSLYGTHPWYWYIAAGLPAIAGIMTPLLLFEFVNLLKSRISNSKKVGFKNTLFIVMGMYLTLHSFSVHKEFRFIMPLLPLVCIICAYPLRSIVINHGTSIPNISLYLILWLILLNIPHLLFLNRIHQRGPFDVKNTLVDHISQKIQSSNLTEVSIDYLMGCHSMPLYSTLHIKVNRSDNYPFPIHAKYLDCSPECRSKPLSICESDRFLMDPLLFIEEEYIDDKKSDIDGDSTCTKRSKPDMIVIHENDYVKRGVSVFLDANDYNVIANSSHSLKGVDHLIKGYRWTLEFQYDKYIILSRLK